MDVWVISDHEGLTNRIRVALERPESGCPYVRVSNIVGCLNSGVMSAAPGDVVLYVATMLTTQDFALIRQLKATMRARLAVVASTTDSTVVLRAIRSGAEDFLDADGSLADEIKGFISNARVAQPELSSGRLWTVLSTYMPCDASILSVNLSAAVARQCGSCVLIDFHRRGGDLALLLKLSPRHTLNDLMRQENGIDQVMFDQALAAHHSGIRLLAGPQTSTEESPFGPASYDEIVRLALGTHPIVFASSDDASHISHIMPFSNSERIVLALRLDLLSLHRAQQHIQFLRGQNVPMDKVEVVAMGTGIPGELPAVAAAKVLNVPRIHLVPNDPLTTIVSINLGNPFVLESPTSPASTAIKRLASQLLGSGSGNAPESGRPLTSARTAALGAVKALMGRR